MEKLLLVLLLSTICICSYAQKAAAFKSLRYDEDYAYLKEDSSSNWYAKMKYSPLSKNGQTHISFGGEIRYQYFNIKNEDWGDAVKDKDGYILSRFLLHADLHTAKFFRTFIQLQSSLANGRINTSPVDENALELHQALIDVNFLNSKKNKWLLRIGRQEFSYGSQRLVAVRDGPNNRQSFDAVKSIFTTGNYRADLFFSHYVKAKKEIFNDGFNKDTKFWGAYATRNNFYFLQNIDLYYLGLWKRKATFDEGTAEEMRHSVGSRIWSSKSRLKYDIEGLYQFGKFGDKDINAWTLSFNTSYKFKNIPLKPESGIKTEFISGDANYGDNKLQSFSPLFPRGSYFGLASLIGPANLFDIHPSVAFELKKTLLLNIDYDLFWRYSKNDGIYTPGVALIYSGKNNPYKFIGNQLATDIVYTPNNFLYFRGELTWFNAGDYLKAAGTGKNILFSCITAQLKF